MPNGYDPAAGATAISSRAKVRAELYRKMLEQLVAALPYVPMPDLPTPASLMPLAGLLKSGRTVNIAKSAKLRSTVMDALEKAEFRWHGRHNFVPIGSMRETAKLGGNFDKTILDMARRNEIVLAGWDGPLPIPRERLTDFIQDEYGNWYTAIARPRN